MCSKSSWRSVSRAANPGFSLVEVVITMAIVAIAVPIMLGLFSFFSKTSSDAVNREEAARAFTAISLFLNGNLPDASTLTAGASGSTGTPLGGTPGAYFTTVLGWVQNNTTTFVYAYKPPTIVTGNITGSSTAGYFASTKAPATGGWTGTLFVGEIQPLTINNNNLPFLPAATMSANPYLKGYIPVEVSIYARAAAVPVGTVTLPKGSLVDSYPAVVLR